MPYFSFVNTSLHTKNNSNSKQHSKYQTNTTTMRKIINMKSSNCRSCGH